MRKCFALACSMTLLVSTAALAQDRPPREGFWISFGLGAGSAGFECDFCDDDRNNGGAGYLRMGGTPGTRFLVGGEINAWFWNDDEDDRNLEAAIGSIFGTVLFFPSETAGFYLQGGLGFTGFVVEGDNAKLETSGFGVLLGMGYDIRVARNFSLTPYVSYSHSLSSDVELTVDGASVGIAEDVNPNLFQLGLGFTWH